MHYCDIDFKNKKALKEAVAARVAFLNAPRSPQEPEITTNGVFYAPPVTVHNPETFSGEPPTPRDGTVCVGGPHYPVPHTWFARVTLVAGEVVKVQ